MTDAERSRERAAEAEIRRLTMRLKALTDRVRHAEADVRAAGNARDVALRLAARLP